MTTLGIDLGTSNSLVAYWNEDKAVLIPNVFGEVLTPSVVGVDDNGEFLIGKIAKERLTSHPDKTAAVFKRFMGTEKNYYLGKQAFSATDLSSFVLKSLKADAEKFLGEACTEAVISVPAYFNNSQRKATIDAAFLAGLKVERLISEPTAAAIAYGIHEQNDTTLMVIDIGGGTFDVSILEMFDGVMQVIAIGGNNYLGGEDFTSVIIEDFLSKNDLKKDDLSAEDFASLYKQAEDAKKSICHAKTGEITLNEINYTITENQFEIISQPLILKLREPIIQALKDADLKPVDIEQVVLIGGATKMPIIKSFTSKFLGKIPFMHINPDETVGLGAAVQAALKERHESLEEFVLTDVCAHTLGTEIVKEIGPNRYQEGIFSPIIERNTTIPVSRVENYYTISDNQSHIEFGVYQGESRNVKDNLKLGELLVSLPPETKAGSKMEVRFTYDKNGILEVLVKTVATGEVKQLIIQNNPGAMSKKELEEQLEKLSHLKIHPRDRSENRLLLARADRIYQMSLGERRRFIEFLIAEFEQVVETQDEKKIEAQCEKLRQQLDEFEGVNWD
ncbi:molecular chaperone HscC [Listeria cossartiae subsp. cayugensis]|uniref:Chaperone protein DnaK n=1 Tax=Listeria cossartiae subsp. cayugensis TaxID=2713505 RepID=A0ABU2IMF8_9LIST|nr:molecular chaperone HscC [Listeria cossartiae]MDT0049372.1 molecular chaperone HscC [Listeria cossartiae subsp. cayugensis]MDT0065875.1 molecular chaperone HscC [Listeria cossartiae subsp. cayugensis]MDT0078521.1 molecular chaperone HscC [Listeria cossartiae subsp. cayugensis]MDT0081357.1 molecular chaperone HscC [Listeria cossartiae subsp. cayugensis]MDT0088108.1 molecular chaperone HscC [Listeria cossartiae subsp. cayugensis]